MNDIDPASISIEFPCDYPIRIVGDACTNFEAEILQVISKHAPGFDQKSIARRDSKKGNYQSIAVIIQAQGEEQLKALFEDLKATGIVRLVL